jgi:predicted GNAT superfamily acetyltransferase
MQYRVTQSIEDMHRIVALELEVWGLNPIDAVPAHVLAMGSHNGGVVIIAEEQNETLVGFAVGFPARRQDRLLLWSHIAGVAKTHQGQGIGKTLKFMQREWAGSAGYEEIGWTFDPLQPGNANFNLNILGAVAVRYHPNFYGQMEDVINHRPLPSDRLEARWPVRAVPTRASSTAPRLPVFLVEYVAGQQLPLQRHIERDGITNAEYLAIQVPQQTQAEDYNLEGWQLAIRQAFQEALILGYRATGFVRDTERNYYLLTR